MAEETNTTQSTEPQFNICPCCGKPTLPQPVKPDQLLVDHWLSCMLTGVPFTHTYPIYGGKIKITLSMLSADMDAKLGMLTNMLDALEGRSELLDRDAINISQLKAMARLYSCVKSISLQLGGAPKEYQPMDMVCLALDELLPIRADILAKQNKPELPEKIGKVKTLLTSSDTVSAVPLELLAAAMETHRQVNGILMQSGFDENFWAGIKLG